MRMIELESRTPERLDRLLEVWERSVRATHLFLSGGAVEAIKAYVPQALREVPRLVTTKDEAGLLAGFLGADGRRLEMLFLLPEARGKGLGRALLQYGMDRYGLRELAAAGIHTSEELTEAGSEDAFFRLKTLYPNVCLVHLYALEGAVRGVDFNALPPETKADLKAFSDTLRGKGGPAL